MSWNMRPSFSGISLQRAMKSIVAMESDGAVLDPPCRSHPEKHFVATPEAKPRRGNSVGKILLLIAPVSKPGSAGIHHFLDDQGRMGRPAMNVPVGHSRFQRPGRVFERPVRIEVEKTVRGAIALKRRVEQPAGRDAFRQRARFREICVVPLIGRRNNREDDGR
jgi:hypothetical protein